MGQFATFYVGEQMCGIEVEKVQEVVRSMPTTPVPQAHQVVSGLINLRGQIATAIDTGQLFWSSEDSSESKSELKMNVICRSQGALVSLLVDRIGDVLDIDDQNCESVPDTVDQEIRRFLSGVFKTRDNLVSIVDIDIILEHINHSIKG